MAVSMVLLACSAQFGRPTQLANRITRWVNQRHLRRPEVGGSGSHFLSAIARATARFPGSTADDLKRAIREGTTVACGSVYGPIAICEYLRDRLAWKRFCLSDPITWVRPE